MSARLKHETCSNSDVTDFFFLSQSPCDKEPCLNGGKCLPIYEQNSYRCQCPWQFNVLKHCEEGKFLFDFFALKESSAFFVTLCYYSFKQSQLTDIKTFSSYTEIDF